MGGGDWLRAYARRAENEGARAAVHAMSQAAQEGIQEALGKRSHARTTKTPSPPGSPPARISGRLQASVIATLPRSQGPGVWESEAGPKGVIYAAVQERGATIHARRAPYLVFFWQGRWHRRKSVTIPARPYVKPTVEHLRASGRLHDISSAAFFRAVHGG